MAQEGVATMILVLLLTICGGNVMIQLVPFL